ncbi:MAG: xanthine dehydrogenase family protein molybdopterin-binding subunit, partial [Gammaproteobacteria bacterium]|nr:xanthine dehydrogenase family protein molybdopterin-binding subunit [Gammaproteobacteria bacterium]
MNDAAPEPRDNQGEPLPRIDARLKVTGEARYAADIPVANLAYGVLVTSEVARGAVTRIALEAARAAPGVIGVISYDDIEGLKPPKFGMGSYTSLGPLHERRIWHDGQIMALVVAESFQAAEEAAMRVTAEYAAEPASAELDSPGTEELDAAGKVAMLKKDPAAGDFAEAYRQAPVRIEAEYRTPTQTHNPIELFSTTAVWSDGQLTVYEPTQSVYGFRAQIARQLDLDIAQVRVVSPYVGGAFGSKGPITPRTAIVALAARRLNRPVRCVVSRGQGFTTQPYRAPTRHRIRLGASRDGRITAFSHEGWELTSRLDNYAVAGTETTTRLYGYGAVASKVRLVKADRQTPSFMRSPPELPYMFPLESALDELAYALQVDPVELRLLNDAEHEPIEGRPFSSRHLKECYREGAAAFGWSARNPRPASMRSGDWLIGLGCATAVYPTNVGAAAARVRLGSDGSVLVQSASHEIGTGIRTVAGQMAAERLGVAFSAVTVETGDTNLPPAPTSGGSNSTASVCSAVLRACEQVREKIFAAATRSNSGALAGRAATELSLRDGTVVAADGARQPLAEVLRSMGAGAIEEYAEFVPAGAPPDAMQRLYRGESSLVRGEQHPAVAFAFGAEFVEVRIHARTREIRVPRLLGAFAAGRIMNTRTARSQLMGGMIWGMSAALLESTELDPRDARTLNRDLQDYLVPVNADVGEVRVIMLSEVDPRVNPAGVKGIGELGNVGTNAAVANAVFHATGFRVRTLP